MKTKLFICIALMFHVVSANAQNMYGKPEYTIKGGEEGKNYAVIIKTDMSKKELVKQTTDFLAKYTLVDPKDVHLDEITENLAEYSLPILIRQTIAVGKGMMGMPYTDCPVKMYGRLRFEFYDNGNVMIVYENFHNMVLAVKSSNTGTAKRTSNEEKYYGEMNMQLTANTAVGKILIWANVGLEDMSDFYSKLDDYFADINSKYAVYDQMVKEGTAEWLSGGDYVNWRASLGDPGAKIAPYLQKYVDEGKMLAVSQSRWENKIRPVCDNLFIAISQKLKGEIVGVAEDGIQTWNLDGDKLLPTDAKLKKKYVKKGLSYFNQE